MLPALYPAVLRRVRFLRHAEKWNGPLGLVLAISLLVSGVAGCTRSTLQADEIPTSRPVQGIGQAFFEERVQAMVVPPEGWEADPIKTSDRHRHLVWLSPTGDTAYGVIYASIPGWVPVPFIPSHLLHERVLDEFMNAMRSDQGEATLLSRRWDGDEDRMYFEAEGGLYRIDSVLSVRGHSAWSVYAGTLREREVNEEELALARRARDATQIGRDAAQE